MTTGARGESDRSSKTEAQAGPKKGESRRRGKLLFSAADDDADADRRQRGKRKENVGRGGKRGENRSAGKSGSAGENKVSDRPAGSQSRYSFGVHKGILKGEVSLYR